MSDPIAQALTAVLNSQAVRKPTARVVYSKTNYAVCKILEQYGFVDGVERAGKKDKKYLEVTLKYGADRLGVIHTVRRVSKPGKRVYAGYRELHWPQGVLIVVSTPDGIMAAHEAKKKKLGGELICSVS